MNGRSRDAVADAVTGRALSDRAAGVLLHPTSLPGSHGIGDLGPSAVQFVDFLSASRLALWQILPLNPIGGGHSPYASPSAFAGNPLLISLERLVDEGLIERSRVIGGQTFPRHYVDYERVWAFKQEQLIIAWQRFARDAGRTMREAFDAFCQHDAYWLEDYALFMALREINGNASWVMWPGDLSARDSAALDRAREAYASQIEFHKFLQFVFHRQWLDLRGYALRRGIRIIGDIPIFVAHDSVDVWAHPEMFYLDESGQPSFVAGVPPDYFSATGQRWGNPLYRWERLAENRYAWWIARLRATLELVDAVRLDHFRGFQAFWQVPASHATAQHGWWSPGPGAALFRAIEAEVGGLPIIVEDLGLITPGVEELRDELGYPGMKVLHFAFDGDAANPHLPHNYSANCVVYTATHDNDTTAGWFASLSARERAKVRRYIGCAGGDIAWAMIRLALGSVARTAIVPLQDVLTLSSGARMNFPGKSEGNWRWRLATGQLGSVHADRLAELVVEYGRAPGAR